MGSNGRWVGRMAGAALCLSLASAWAGAQATPAPNPKLVQQYAKLQAEANTHQGAKKAENLAKLAELDFAFAHSSYLADATAEGDQNLDRATQHADQACALLHAELAQGKTKEMKNVEMSLQNVTYGLQDLAQRVHYSQRPKVEAAASHFADLRADLLQWMFAPKPKKGA